MLTIVLCQPQIAPNTGNIMRLCANTGAQLALVRPYGFVLDDKKLRRAGMDYREYATVKEYDDFASCYQDLHQPQQNWWLFTTHGKTLHSDQPYQSNDVLVFGSETSGVDQFVRQHFDENHTLCLPMCRKQEPNLSNSVAIGLYEAWRVLLYG